MRAPIHSVMINDPIFLPSAQILSNKRRKVHFAFIKFVPLLTSAVALHVSVGFYELNFCLSRLKSSEFLIYWVSFSTLQNPECSVTPMEYFSGVRFLPLPFYRFVCISVDLFLGNKEIISWPLVFKICGSFYSKIKANSSYLKIKIFPFNHSWEFVYHSTLKNNTLFFF